MYIAMHLLTTGTVALCAGTSSSQTKLSKARAAGHTPTHAGIAAPWSGRTPTTRARIAWTLRRGFSSRHTGPNRTLASGTATQRST